MKVGILLAAPLALSTVSSTATLEELHFVPAKGLVLERTFEMVIQQEIETTSEQDLATSSSSSERTLVVTDEIQAVVGDRITKLSRTFDEISCEGESSVEAFGHSQDVSGSGSCEVEGSTVVFEWDKDDEEYVATSDEVDGDVLAELVFDYEFTALLPDDEVVEGDEWNVDIEAFRLLSDPWKGLPWGPDSSDGESFEERSDDQEEPEIDDQEEGEIVASFAGTREVDGVILAIIVLEGELELERTVDATSEREQGSTTWHSESSVTSTLEGEALWDLEAGRLHSMEVDLESSMTSTTHTTFIFGDREFETDYECDRERTKTFSVSTVSVE